jgi:iron complex transport system substrate-binding protein
VRIVSLLPSATEIVAALGLADELVGISHECDYPPAAVAGKAIVTSSTLPRTVHPVDDDDESLTDADPQQTPTAAEIHERVRTALAHGESLYRVDTDLLRSLNPDLVITQGLCDVCAVTHHAAAAAAAAVGSGVPVLDLSPTSLMEVYATFLQVGAATGREREAASLATSVQARWDAVRERAAAAPERPRTLLLEWPDPAFSAGHWNPELLVTAGGVGGPWDVAGHVSRVLSWQEICDFAPEMLVLIACGMDAYRALEEAYALPDAPGWFDLPAVRNGECYAADGSAYFNRPGPRLAESAEILATILHPETFTEMLPPYSVQRFSNDLLEPESE